MANRTIQFLGQGYAPTGTDPITVSATLNGNVVYTGTIPTSYTSEINHLADAQTVLFTCELPVDFSGTVPMSISLDSPVGVTVFFEQVQSNYMIIANPAFTAEQIAVLTNPATSLADRITIWTACAVPPLSAAEITILESGVTAEIKPILDTHNLQTTISSGASKFLTVNGASECRTNVVINGVATTRQSEPPGDWGWIVEFPTEGSGLFECNLTTIAGLE
jgi:hypothetical protein